MGSSLPASSVWWQLALAVNVSVGTRAFKASVRHVGIFKLGAVDRSAVEVRAFRAHRSKHLNLLGRQLPSLNNTVCCDAHYIYDLMRKWDDGFDCIQRIALGFKHCDVQNDCSIRVRTKIGDAGADEMRFHATSMALRPVISKAGS